MTYKLVIVPPGLTLASNTVRLLREFAAAGGTILALDPIPTRVDAQKSTGPVLPGSARTLSLKDLIAALDATLPPVVQTPARPDIWIQHRQAGESQVFFLANTSLEIGGEAEVWLSDTGALEEWDLASGQVCPLPAAIDNGRTRTMLDFPPRRLAPAGLTPRIRPGWPYDTPACPPDHYPIGLGPAYAGSQRPDPIWCAIERARQKLDPTRRYPALARANDRSRHRHALCPAFLL